MNQQELIHRLTVIKQTQYAFQKRMGIDMTDPDVLSSYRLGESYLMKTIEEIVELRKCFPSGFNRWEKNPPRPDFDEMHKRIREEFADVALFLVNFTLVFGITLEEVLDTVEEVQEVNIKKLQEKQNNAQ